MKIAQATKVDKLAEKGEAQRKAEKVLKDILAKREEAQRKAEKVLKDILAKREEAKRKVDAEIQALRENVTWIAIEDTYIGNVITQLGEHVVKTICSTAAVSLNPEDLRTWVIQSIHATLIDVVSDDGYYDTSYATSAAKEVFKLAINKLDYDSNHNKLAELIYKRDHPKMDYIMFDLLDVDMLRIDVRQESSIKWLVD